MKGTAARVRRAFLVCVAIAALMVSAVGVDLNAANPSATLSQWANLDNAWVNGNLGASKSMYFEGDGIPYRMVFDNLSIGDHTLVIEWDTTKAGKHALDYLTTFNYRVGKVLNAPNPPLNPCVGISGCGSPTTFAIPNDPQVTNAGVTPVAGNFTFYGGTVNSVEAYVYAGGTGFAGDKTASIAIHFTATRANPVLAWAGRIATRKDWGNGNSAVAISGSPYHTRLVELDGAGGNQDRSLSAAAVIFPAAINITKEVQTSGGDNSGIDPQAFAFTGTGQVAASLSLSDNAPVAGENPDVTPKSGTIELNLFGNANSEVVAEATYAAFDQTASCTVSDAGIGGGTVTSGTGITRTVVPAEGMVVDCTFFNKLKAAQLTVIKTVTRDNGGLAEPSAFSVHVKTGGVDVTASPASPQPGSSTGTTYTLPAGNYVVSEDAATGYTQTSISGDCNATTGAVTLAAGDNKTCTITNNDVAPSLTLVKAVNNANGGDAEPDDFTLKATGSTTSLNAKPAAGENSITSGSGFYAGAYTLGEDTVTDYTAAGPYSCVVNGQAAVVSNSLTLLPGDVATCTITNNDAKAGPTGETVQRAMLHDTITISGIRPDAPDANAATVTFRLYPNNSCTPGTEVGSESRPITADGVVTTVTGVGPVAKSATITAYYWRVEFSGDSFNTGFNTACSNEITTISFNK